MFGYFARKRLVNVRRVIARQRDLETSRHLQTGNRNDARGTFCRPVWMIPLSSRGEPDYAAATPVMTKDVSEEGASLVLTAPLTERQVVIGFPEDGHITFLRCSIRHMTPVGLGFWQIGLHPEEALVPPLPWMRELLQRGGEPLPSESTDSERDASNSEPAHAEALADTVDYRPS